MKKGKIVTISVLISVVVLLIVLSCTLFNLGSVDIEYLVQAENSLVLSKEKIYKAGEFKLGSNLLFTKFDENVNKIEKECPNIKVVKVVKKFPNKLAVYVVEREEQFRIVGPDDYNYIFDEDMKLIRKAGTESECGDLCKVTGYTLPEKLTEGDFLNDSVFKAKMSAIIDGIYTADRTPTSIMSNIILSKNALNNDEFLFKFKSGAQMKIAGLNNLEERVYRGISKGYHILSQELSFEQLSILKLRVYDDSMMTVVYDFIEEWQD